MPSFARVLLPLLLLSSGLRAHPVPAVRDDSPDCTNCQFVVTLMEDLWGDKTLTDCLGDFVAFVCSVLNIEDNFVCSSIGRDFEEEAQWVLSQIIVNPNEICSLIVKNCGTFFDPLNATWFIPIPGKKPPVQTDYPNPTADKPKLRVLHLSDIHIDPQYTEGLEADCTEPQCCRPLQDPNERAKDIKKPAGHWGTVSNCDSPYWLVTNMLDHIAATHKDIDYVVVSGDLESHAVWDYKKESHQASVRNISDTIRQKLNLPTYFAVGNHEGVPIDSFPPSWVPPKFNMSWMYNTMADAWGSWLDAGSLETVRYNGCYMKKLFPGLRLISLNNGLGDTVNFYLYINQTDPDGAMSWLLSELADAENNGDKVHIVAHIPGGGGEALEGWSINYYNIINRYESTVTAQFFGHTHTDEFHVTFEDPEDQNSRTTSLVYSAPSVTPYSESQPAYRIYTIDGNYNGSSFAVLDYEEYFLNLTKANADPQNPQWETLFTSVKQEYGLKSMAPSEWSDLINRMKTDTDLFEKYRKYYYRRDDLGACDVNCRHGFLCNSRRAHHTKNLCDDIPGTKIEEPSNSQKTFTKEELRTRFNKLKLQHKSRDDDTCPL